MRSNQLLGLALYYVCNGVVGQGLLAVKCFQKDQYSGMMACQEGIECFVEGLESVCVSRLSSSSGMSPMDVTHR